MRTKLGIALASGAIAGALALSGGASAATNVVGFANLGLTQMLTLDASRSVITTWADNDLRQVWDQVYRPEIPTEAGMSSPYQLRVHDSDVCLQDVGDGKAIVALPCEANPTAGSPQLWQNHRVEDRIVGNREYYFLFNRRTDRVLTAFPTTPNPDAARVISAPAQPITKSGAADVQLWTILAAA